MTEDKKIVLERNAFKRLRYLGVGDVAVGDLYNHTGRWISDASYPLTLNPVGVDQWEVKWRALRHLRYLGVENAVVKDLYERGRVWISDASSPSHPLILNPVGDDLQEKILMLQEETGGRVYHVIRNMYDSRAGSTGIVDTFLIALPGRKLIDRLKIRNGRVTALIVNEDAPDGFYSGLVYVRPEHGGLDRSNGIFDYEAFHRDAYNAFRRERADATRHRHNMSDRL